MESIRNMSSRRGAIAVFAAFLMILMMAMIAFGVDVGRMVLDRTKVQQAVDAASLAASDALANASDPSEVETVAEFYLLENGVDPDELGADDFELEYGTWDADTRTFISATFENANTVRIFTRLADRSLFFGSVIGRDAFDAEAEAVATISRGEPQDIMMVIDCSTSMSSNNRMPYTISAAQALLAELRSDDRVGLTVYSWPDPLDNDRKTGHLETTLDFNHTPTMNIVPTLTPGYYVSGTNIAGGMRVGLDEMRINLRANPDDGESKVMVVLTDGRANLSEPPGSDEWDSIAHYADVAVLEDVIIHAITLGDDASEAAMQSAAAVTGGTYHHINDGNNAGLEEIFRQIGQGIGNPRLVD